jgi:hypothetical protein
VQYQRDWRHYRDVRKTTAMDLLCRFLELTPAELQDQWLEYIGSL